MELSHLDWTDEKRFKKLPENLTPKEVAALLRVKDKSVYRWRYRPDLFPQPKGLFKKFNGKVFVIKSVLKKWWDEQ